MTIYKPARLSASASKRSFAPVIANTPALPVIDWSRIGQVAPKLVGTTSSGFPSADAIVLTWADAEWAALQHVFCDSGSTMPYAERSTDSWSGWNRYSTGLPSSAPSGWTFWGEWRLVQIANAAVMLFKSNTHLDWPGQTYLADLIRLLIQHVKPGLILSVGTAGGAQTGDHVGTVRAVSAGTLYKQNTAPGSWPVYRNSWSAVDTLLDNPGFGSLLLPIPTTVSDLQSLCTQFNQYYNTSFSLADLDPDGLNYGDPSPGVHDQTGGAISLLTTPDFVVGTNAGDYDNYVCIEMDDSIIGEVCGAAGTAFGFVRNISDPVQSASLSAEVQGNWGSTIYTAYGFYTSYNSALTAWAMLAGKY